jgi:hypothetical protein
MNTFVIYLTEEELNRVKCAIGIACLNAAEKRDQAQQMLDNLHALLSRLSEQITECKIVNHKK